VAGLRQVGQQRVVAGILAVMGVEAAEGPAHRRPGPTTVPSTSIVRRGRARRLTASMTRSWLGWTRGATVLCMNWRNQLPTVRAVAIRANPWRSRAPATPRCPAPSGRCSTPWAGGPSSAEAGDEGIAGEIAQVLQPPGPDVEERQDEEGQPAPAVVPARGHARGAQPARQVELPQIPAEHFQPAVRGQLVAYELDVQLPLDHPSQARYAQAHQGGLLCGGSDVGTSSPLKNAQGAVLFHRILNQFTSQLFSDWR
jgi:hypothetical protein